MQYPKYPLLEKSTDNLKYSFFSEGPNGRFLIVALFEETGDDEMVNLAFGAASNGEIDDQVVFDNGDRNKIIATIYDIINEFTKTKTVSIFFKGSNKARTRLYRMAIALNLNFLSNAFLIWGV